MKRPERFELLCHMLAGHTWEGLRNIFQITDAQLRSAIWRAFPDSAAERKIVGLFTGTEL